jgi:hypothetical protein
MTGPDACFVVCIHDAWPANAGEISRVLDAVRPLVGGVVSVAATPLPRGEAWPDDARAADLVRLLRERAAEVLLHGLTHARPPSLSPFSYLIGNNDEFAQLSPDETVDRLRQGRQLLGAVRPEVRGVLPPAWRAGNIPAALADAGLDFVVGMSRVRGAGGRHVPLATWSWDPGPVAPLAYVLELWGTVLSCRRSAVPCVAIHPADVRRGLLRRVTDRIERLLRHGMRPTTFGELWDRRSRATA